MSVALRTLVLFGLLVLAAPTLAQPQVVLFPGLEGQPLLDAIRAAYAPGQVLGYDRSRDSLFAWEDRTTGGLRCVYTGHTIALTPGADPSTDAFLQGINTEHTWPQSWGASTEPSRSDMHHLYPVRDNVNSSRGNHPYGEVPDPETDVWYRLAASQTTIPTVAVDEWSEKDHQHPHPAFFGRFEPREDHSGDAARAVFYYRAVYPDRVQARGADEFFEVQRVDLLAWHYEDPVGPFEFARGEWIASRQGRMNPFVLDSTLARRAFQSRIDTGGGPPQLYPATVWVNELHYDNEGADVGEFVELAVPESVEPSSVWVYLYNGNGGAVYDSVSVSAFTPGQTAGGHRIYHRVWPANTIQNGSPDGVAVVVEGEVVQFLSYEGVFEATNGPAAGMMSVDMGVQETGTTPVGHSLQLRGMGAAYADFTWHPPSPASPGLVNVGQSFVLVTTAPAPSARETALRIVGPNPVANRVAVEVVMPVSGRVRVEAFDVTGRRLATVHDGIYAAGAHRLVWDVNHLPHGVYLLRGVMGGANGSAVLTVVR